MRIARGTSCRGALWRALPLPIRLPKNHSPPASLSLNQWRLSESWNVGGECFASSSESTGEVREPRMYSSSGKRVEIEDRLLKSNSSILRGAIVQRTPRWGVLDSTPGPHRRRVHDEPRKKCATRESATDQILGNGPTSRPTKCGPILSRRRGHHC